MTIVGPVVSRLTIIDFKLELPAESISVMVKVLAPSVKVKALVLAIVSEVYETVILALFVVELLAGEVMTIAGGIVSKVPCIDLVVELPAESVSVIVNVFRPSVKVKGFVLAVPSEV